MPLSSWFTHRLARTSWARGLETRLETSLMATLQETVDSETKQIVDAVAGLTVIFGNVAVELKRLKEREPTVDITGLTAAVDSFQNLIASFPNSVSPTVPVEAIAAPAPETATPEPAETAPEPEAPAVTGDDETTAPDVDESSTQA